MIELTRLNGDSFHLNAVMIEQIQSYPDTTITLINGKKIVVHNSEREVTDRILSFYKQVGIAGPLNKVGETSE